jgi:hypothetical protein
MRSIQRVGVTTAGFTADSGEAAAEESSFSVDSKPDKYVTRLLKYVPTEVIVLYTTINNIVLSSSPAKQVTLWIPFGICMVAVYVYLWRMQERDRRSGQKIDKICWADIHISGIAFIIWVLALGGPFVTLPSFDTWGHLTSAILLPTFTFFAPILAR